MKEKVRELKIVGVKVVFVVFGEEVSEEEFEEIIGNKNNLVEMEIDEDLDKVVEKIMIKVFEGNLCVRYKNIIRIIFWV